MIRIVLFVFLAVLGLRAEAAEPTVRLQRFLQDVTALSAHFEQTQTADDGKVLATRAGRFQLARPGRFRWHYQTPYEQLMVCDGQRIWNYEPDLAQVTVRDARDILRDTPVALLAEGKRLEERFSVTEGGMEGEVQRLILEPRTADADFRRVELWLQPNGVPVRMRLHDPLGGVSDIRFNDVQRNARIDAAQFSFAPPAGVEVVQMDGAPQ
ncbi:outer membrane lipoprotein chaperone LolA [Fontimonas sp. SYSU GA230001]|uniref:outer membrane lipoprotein chaperone LolA n=1 Tax=Fontimonas sp. SYSU GA230001 TaxID=3142450 RepID=UPI0032B54603